MKRFFSSKVRMVLVIAVVLALSLLMLPITAFAA